MGREGAGEWLALDGAEADAGAAVEGGGAVRRLDRRLLLQSLGGLLLRRNYRLFQLNFHLT